ncbi:MAG: hypothetical protein ABIN97_12795 [Ginsengibacter sp.]
MRKGSVIIYLAIASFLNPSAQTIKGPHVLNPQKISLTNELNNNPVIGAIRWDGWYYGRSDDDITAILEKTLAPKEFHNRLPFFAKEISDDSVYINGSSQEVIDEEIAYAKTCGLDYWAFVMYPENTGLSIGLKNYLASKYRGDINFCVITEEARLTNVDTSYTNNILTLIKQPGYQIVLENRPLWYIGFVDSAHVQKAWGGFRQMKSKIDSMRNTIIEAGLGNPYIVIMDFNAAKGKQWCDSLGADAISSYVTQKSTPHASYKTLTKEAEQFWEECKGTGTQVVPVCDAGWNPKPRIDYVNIWSHFYPKDVYYDYATPAEVTAHIKSGMEWTQKNKAFSNAQCVIIYAWNEYDEGGWLGPMLHEGSARIDAVGKMIREFKKKNKQ